MRTSLYTILCVAIRLGATFLAFGALARLPGTVVAWKQGVTAASVGLASIVIGVAVLLALALWIYPGVLARIAAGKNSREIFESPIAPAELQWIALSVLGVYFTFDAVVSLVHYGFRWAFFAQQYAESDENRTSLIADMGYYVIELVAGLALAYGARGLTALLRRVRYGNAAAIGERDTEPRSASSADVS
jgi:hypothetical protein